CDCNPDGAKEIPGFPLGGCGIVTSGLLCECKDKVLGRICDRCQPGFWNLNRNNPEGCEECGCNMAGTLTSVKRCDMETGQCECKPYVTGQNCDTCRNGFWGLEDANPFGCRGCNCNPGGSLHNSCNKTTGACFCKAKVGGDKCDKPLDGYFYPDLHQYKFELEDGTTPDGARVRYGYNETVFPEFSWKGYAILTEYQPEVLLDVNIRIPSLYQIIYRYINRGGNPFKGTVVLTPDSVTENTQEGEVNFLKKDEPSFVDVTSGGIQAFVLNPGRWRISTKVPEDILLDYFILIPQAFYEASQLQDKITDPCVAKGDAGPCVAITYPDLGGFPIAKGKDGYHIVDGQKENIDLDKDTELTDELDSPGLALLTRMQDHFLIDLIVPNPDDYILIVNYHNPLNYSQDLNVMVDTSDDMMDASVTLPSCPYSALCRQVIRGANGLEGVFNISSGYAALTFTAGNGTRDIYVAIDSVYAIPLSRWAPIYALPKIICIKVNGICVVSSYGIPVGTVLIQFEAYPNQGFLSIVLPPDILDQSVRVVNLNDSRETVNQTSCQDTVCTSEPVVRPVPLELLGNISKPGEYVLIVHYYMPTESRLDIPVTLYDDDGLPISGKFEPGFCPNNVGCRVALTFDQAGGRKIGLNGPGIRVVFNGTLGRTVYLDYMLIIPASQFSPDYLEIEPIDNSNLFITKCVDAGFQLNLTDPYCKASAFTLTTNFNNGALDCKCNKLGSRSFTCSREGGSCLCKKNVIGRQCTACAQGYYGFPKCKKCDCPYGICDENNGKCICPPNVGGEKCERCDPGAYGYDPIIGCQLCNCNTYGTVDRNTSCHQETGKCDCKPNVDGRRCDTCLAGHHTFPECLSCGCDTRGTHEEICDQRTSECLCKDNVEGMFCDQCADGMYSLTAENPKGCIKCFCFDHTTKCDSSGLSWDTISDMRDWFLMDLLVDNITTTLDMGTSLVSRSEDGVLDDTSLFYFAPPTYLGKKLNAYGGKLEYTVVVTVPDEDEIIPVNKENVLITGSNMSLLYYHNTQPAANVPFKFEVELREYNFIHQITNAQVTRSQFMNVLLHLDSLLIRGSYFEKMEEIRLEDVTMQVATTSGQGQLAESVEKCSCPPNYEGASCEVCAPGSYRSLSSTSLDICIKCNCNGHSDDCDIHTGVCYNCQHNTTGSNCEQCLPGYYGDPRTGGCTICSCPLPLPANNFATTCIADEQGYMRYCQCQPGYTGPQCDTCAPGYYGNPLESGDYCKPCDCSGNINLNLVHSCDNIGGACLICENNSAGPKCQRCRDWYYGDAVTQKDCRPCTCDTCGSNSCDYENGTCECKPNVVGANCDQCGLYTWGFNFCTGCRDCECGVGSVTQQCDLQLGYCTCQPGVEGEKCDRCKPNHWNIGPSGCQECDCLGDGAVGCDPDTGRCQCLPGVTGEQCDRCLPRWVLVANKGCQECDYCTHLLIDDLDQLANDVTQVSRTLADVSVGVGAFNKLSYYNETVEMLRPAVEDLKMMNRSEFNNSLVMLGDKMNNASQNTRALQEKTDMLEYEAQLLPENIEVLIQNVSDLFTETEDVDKFSSSVVGFIQQVQKSLESSGSALNLERYITLGEEMVQEIENQNFTSQQNSCRTEDQAAEELKDLVESLKMNASTSVNRTEAIGNNISDIESRLQDLANSSSISQANIDSTMSMIARLKAAGMRHLMISLENIETIRTEREEMLKEAVMLLEEAEGLLVAAASNVTDIESQSTRLDAAHPTLQAYVDQVVSEMDGLYDMTNKSQIHAAGLAAAAAELEVMYESTRNRSQDPVDAGQAYRTIENAIAEAKASADKAVEDAELAKAESENIHSNVSDALMVSEALLEDAKQLHNQTQNALQDALDQDRNAFMDAEKKHDGVVELLASLAEGMEKLNGSSTEPVSTAIMAKNNETRATLKDTVLLSQSVIAKTADMNAKNDYIVTNAPKASDDMRQAQESVESAETSQPELKDMVKKLSDVADRVSEKSRTLGLNVASLKEKIAQARDEANRIKVGLSFLGNTTVTLRNPPTLKDTGSYSTVSMFLKTDQSDALLMYVGNNQNVADAGTSKRRKRSITFENDVVPQLSYFDDEDEAVCPHCKSAPLKRERRQVPDFQSDYLGLELRGGNVVFTVNLGSGAANIYSTRQVNDGKWHQILAQRIGKTATLTVKSESQEDDVNEGTTEGTFAVLELNPITTQIVVGGLPDDFTVPKGMTTTPYKGTIEELKFDGELLGLWNFVDAKNNLKGANQRDFQQTTYAKGYRFNGYGYAVLSKRLLRLRPDSTRVELSFKTYSEDGLMFYMGNDDYFALEIKHGHVHFRFDLGGGPAAVQSSAKYNDGEWHKLVIDRLRRSATLLIDDKTEEIQLVGAGKLNNLETTDDIYIGGVDNVLHLHWSVMTKGFDGCMKDVKIAREDVDLFENKRAKGLVKGCIPKITHIVSFPSYKDGYMGVPPVSIGQMFDLTFKMKTEKDTALLMLAQSSNRSNVFAVFMSEGKIVVGEQLGFETKQLSSKINTYGDGEWHYVSIMKMQQRITISIDDTEMMEDDGVSGDLITDSPLYFGGLPLGTEVTSDAVLTTEGIAGCMGDITINKKFQNLAHVQDRHGVTLAECTMDKEAAVVAKPTVSPDLLPDQCALPPVESGIEGESAKVTGIRFGGSLHSRYEYTKLPVRIIVKPVFIELEFKTTGQSGVIFYTAGENHLDFLGLYMEDGQLVFGFNCGTGAAIMKSPQVYNDGNWHKVKFSRISQEGELHVNGEQVAVGRSQGTTRSLNTRAPYFIGGISEEATKIAHKNLNHVVGSFHGCITNVTVNMKGLEPPSKEEDVLPCSDDLESGSFIGKNGGHITLFDKFNVGKNLEIVLQVRPRSQEGVLLAVHGSGNDFLVLQMSEGTLILTVDNGAGPITLTFELATKNTLCDGLWHDITAIKKGNELDLIVDGVTIKDTVAGNPKSTSADTNGPLYIGGVQDKTARGIVTKGDFIGCIRHVQLNMKAQNIAAGTPTGDVHLGSCPVK
ncbi:laminin subunit alpha, partial [Elysia marginata]